MSTERGRIPGAPPTPDSDHQTHAPSRWAGCDHDLLLQRVTDCLERLLVQLAHLEELQRHPPPRFVPVAVDVATAAKLCDVGRTLFYDLLQEGEGPPVAKLGTRTVVRYRSLDAWIARREGKQ